MFLEKRRLTSGESPSIIRLAYWLGEETIIIKAELQV